MPYEKQFIYIATFNRDDDVYQLAFEDLNELRVYLVHGFRLPFDSEKLNITDANDEVIYDTEYVKIKKIAKVGK